MSDCCTPKGYETIFSERNAWAERKRYRKKGLDPLSKKVAETVKDGGVEGRTLLEVGGGLGAIQVELLKAGLERSVNVELTATYEGAAAKLLEDERLTEKVQREILDFATRGDTVEPADVVVLNRVLCCYPEMPRLATAAADHARRTLVLTFPNGRWYIRAGLAAANLLFKVFRVQFHIFSHPPELIRQTVEGRGFTTRLDRSSIVWRLVVFDRAA